MEKYAKMTNEEFQEILVEIINENLPSDLLCIPGIYEILSEEFNNDILTRWEERQVEED